MYKDLLNPKKALIFRICHRDNIGSVLDSGCKCKSAAGAAKYAEIGNQELISKRAAHAVPCGPGGTLSDYVPFYFTPFSPMLYNIKTGYNGIAKKPMEDIVILVSSLHLLKEQGVPFVFSMMHERIRAADPDFADVALAIVQFALSEKGPRVPVVSLDQGVELFTFDELDHMVSETYEMWREVCEERAAEARRRGASGGGGLF